MLARKSNIMQILLLPADAAFVEPLNNANFSGKSAPLFQSAGVMVDLN